MTCIGTSYFKDYEAALRYYAYFGDRRTVRGVVDRKLRDGEIHIGQPRYRYPERLTLIDDGARYAIETRD